MNISTLTDAYVRREKDQLRNTYHAAVQAWAYSIDGPDGTGIGVYTTDVAHSIRQKSLSKLYYRLPREPKNPTLSHMIKFKESGHDERMIFGVAKDGPAYKAGVREGDIILNINGEDTSKMKLVGSEIYSQLVGACGGKVSLKVNRKGKYLSFYFNRGVPNLPVEIFKTYVKGLVGGM